MLVFGMARARTKITLDEAAQGQLEQLYRREREGWKKDRLRALRLAHRGGLTLAEIAGEVGCARSTVQLWLRAWEEGGFDRLLSQIPSKGQPGRLTTDPALTEAFKQAMGVEKWRTARQAQQWLGQHFALEVKLSTLYGWLKKAGAGLRVARPFDVKKNPIKAQEFRQDLFSKLENLAIPTDRPVRVWVQDESRYGLHTVHRRVWALRGVRPKVPHQHKYTWGYVYGALEIVTGQAEFLYMPGVDLPTSRAFLQHLADSDPEAYHVVIWDGAGFHQKEDATDLPERVYLLGLPPYSPELNPVEKLWDIMKDRICNQAFATLAELEAVLKTLWQEYHHTPQKVWDLIGNGWLRFQVNVR